jgi:formyltetrahydrofolate deformylase
MIRVIISLRSLDTFNIYHPQDVVRISHRDGVDDLIRKGRTLEKTTLVAAVKAHLEDRIIVYNNKCVVFGD